MIRSISSPPTLLLLVVLFTSPRYNIAQTPLGSISYATFLAGRPSSFAAAPETRNCAHFTTQAYSPFTSPLRQHSSNTDSNGASHSAPGGFSQYKTCHQAATTEHRDCGPRGRRCPDLGAPCCRCCRGHGTLSPFHTTHSTGQRTARIINKSNACTGVYQSLRRIHGRSRRVVDILVQNLRPNHRPSSLRHFYASKHETKSMMRSNICSALVGRLPSCLPTLGWL